MIIPSSVLIESDWNLKLVRAYHPVCREAVLIESDWNLKSFYNRADMPHTKVLIESDWNLKRFCAAIIHRRGKAY